MRYSSKQLQSAASLAVKYSGLQLFEQHTVSELLWGYQPKFPSVIQYLLLELNMLPTWGIYVGVNTVLCINFIILVGDLHWWFPVFSVN